MANKLTDDQVREMRRLYAREAPSHRDLAELYGISVGYVGRILRGEVYAHLPVERRYADALRNFEELEDG
jgi:hypothetical protein